MPSQLPVVAKMDGEPSGNWERSHSAAIIDEFVVSSTPTGSSFMLKGRSTSDASAVFRPLLGNFSALEGPYSWNSSPPADPMLPAPFSVGSLDPSWGPASINSAVLQTMYPNSRQSLPEVSTSQISYALADSQLGGGGSQFIEPLPCSPSIRGLLQRQASISQSEPDFFTGERTFLAAVLTNPIHFPRQDDGQNEEKGGGGGAERNDFLGGRPSTATLAGQENPDLILADNLSADQKDFEGKIGFRLRFPDCPGKDWIYVEEEKTLYVKTAAHFDVQFILAKAAPPGSLICARAVFMNQGVFGKPVPKLCNRNLHDCQKSFLSTDNRKARTDAQQTVVFSLPVAKRAGIVAARPDKQQSSILATRFALKCRNSCFGFKTRIGLIFEVVFDSSILARVRIDVRSCANPERDSKPSKESDTKKCRKRKRNWDLEDIISDGGVKIKKEARSPSKSSYSTNKKSQWTAEKYGVEQVYGRHPDGSLWLRLQARVRPEAEVFINQIITTGVFLDGLCGTQWAQSNAPLPASMNAISDGGIKSSSPPSIRAVSSSQALSVSQPKCTIQM